MLVHLKVTVVQVSAYAQLSYMPCTENHQSVDILDAGILPFGKM